VRPPPGQAVSPFATKGPLSFRHIGGARLQSSYESSVRAIPDGMITSVRVQVSSLSTIPTEIPYAGRCSFTLALSEPLHSAAHDQCRHAPDESSHLGGVDEQRRGCAWRRRAGSRAQWGTEEALLTSRAARDSILGQHGWHEISLA